MSENGKKAEVQERGFEYDGSFYPWHLTDSGKDLMLIDRITGGMVPHKFFEAANDPEEQFRGPILLSLVATSLRNRHPDWSIERLVRTTENINLGDLEFLGPELNDEEEDDEPTLPPSEGEEDSPESSEKSSGSRASKSKKASATQA